MPLFGRRPRPRRGNANAVSDAALTAAGVRITHQDTDQLRRLIQPWQARAFSYYDQLGEINYASQFYARMLAPLRLYPAVLDANGDWVETDFAPAVAALERIQDPGGGREGLLGAYGRLMFLAGECYLLVTRDPDSGDEQWEMLSTDELRIQSGVYIRYKAPSLVAENYHEPSDDDWEPIGSTDKDDDTALAFRIWQRHPRYSALATSTMQGVLDECEELLLLTRAVRARARSRLAGAGILAISEDFSYAPLEPEPDEDVESDPFLADLTASMTLPIQQEGAASAVVPLVLRGPSEAIEKGIRHIQIVDPTQLYPETGLRFELIKRIAIGLDMPAEVLTGIAPVNHWCVDDQTEILTADGWKTHETLAVGDEALTLNHDSGLSEWKIIEDVARFDVTDLPMRAVESRFHSSLTTLNHRWPVLHLTGRDGRWERAWTHSDELRTTHRLVTAAPSADALRPQLVQHDDALVELVAWLWTEGAISERPGRKTPRVTIYQSHEANPENVLRIRAALTALYGVGALVPMRSDRRAAEWSPPQWRETQHEGKTAFSLNRAAAAPLLVHVGPDRIVSTDFVRTLTASQLALFIDVSVRGDGSLMRSGCAILGQSERERLFPFELSAILLGRSPSSYSQTHDGFRRHEQHYVSVSNRQTVRLKRRHIREARYTGTVWCPVTENSTWLARRNGKVFYTGNSAWQIDEQTWKGHGMQKANQLVNDLSSAYFRPQLREDGVSEWRRYRIGYDPSAVINHPDRTKDAFQAYDRRIISKSAVREVTGHAEKDAPSKDELNEMIGVAVRDGSLALYGIPSVKAGGLEPEPGVVEQAGEPATGTPETDVTGATVEKGPPPGGPPDGDESMSASGNGYALEAARLAGAADLALLRAREAAGNRLRSLAKRDPDAARLLEGVPARDVARTLGPARVRALGTSERDLVAQAADLLSETLRIWGIRDETAARLVVDQIERHAAKTLYDEHPSPLPPQFQGYVEGVLRPGGQG